MRCHKVEPRITHLALVDGARRQTQRMEKMRKRRECDLARVRNGSRQLDLRLLVKTVAVVLSRHNAY
jgi:lipopolysaccharide/colanic/teichoic acid biosynthesis glycosyltransferase